jgi:hypothetical protein
MIRMISGSTRIGKRIYTPVDGCFEATPEVEERLVAQKVAVFVPEEHAEDVATPPAGSDENQACGDTAALNDAAEGEETGHLDPEQLKTMTNDKLRELAQDMGIDTAKLKTKAQLIAAIAEVPLEDAISEDDDARSGEVPPALEPEAPVV